MATKLLSEINPDMQYGEDIVSIAKGVDGEDVQIISGTAVPKSNTQGAIATTGVQQVVSVSIILDVAKGDYLRLFYRGSGTNVRFLAIGTQATPTRPACPSIIMSIIKVGR